MPGKILIVDDDRELVSLVSDAMKDEFFSLDIAEDGKAGLEKATAGIYDLVIIDVNLPELGGFDVCRALREKRPEQMILMLTGRSSTVDKVVGLELGADDYVVKPFAPSELVARVRALLRRARRSGLFSSQLTFGELSIDAARRSVSRGGAEIKLTAVEFDIIYYLASHAGRVISREELKEAVWNYNASEFDSTITSHLSRVRAKIEPNPAMPLYIKTVHGVGYRFAEQAEIAGDAGST